MQKYSPLDYFIGKKPNIRNIDISKVQQLRSCKITVKQIDQVAKQYSLKVRGKKNEKLQTLYCFLYDSVFAGKIQRSWRKKICRIFNSFQGPAMFIRDKCNNSDDFLTVEDITEIPYGYFYSFKDIDGFLYGFNILSLDMLLKKCKPINPYNRRPISDDEIVRIKKRIILNEVMGYSVDKLSKELFKQQETNEEIYVKNQILTITQHLDNFGYYSLPEWFLSLDERKLKKFLYELYDIWNYRANLHPYVKPEICKPYGNPFMNFNTALFVTHVNTNKIVLQKALILCVKNLLQIDVDNTQENKNTCCMYVISALTLVHPQAAETFPWLYQSVL